MTQQIPGIIIREQTNVSKTLLDTRNPRIQIAIDRTPPHLQAMNVTPTAISTNAGNNFAAFETLYSMDHGLGYKPKVFLYILSPAGGYAVGTFYLGFGAINDYITYAANTTSFSIVHKIDDFLNSGYTSTGGTFQLKFLICSNPIDNYTDPAKR